MDLSENSGECRRTQLNLGLPDAAPARSQVRLWLIAAEAYEGMRVVGADGVFRLRAHDRHIFVDSLTGAPAFGSSDLLLLRQPVTGRFTLLVPEALQMSMETRAVFAARLGAALRSGLLHGARGQAVQHAACISFERSGHAEKDGDEQVTRTRLERALMRIGETDLDDPAGILHECGVADRLLTGRTHRAVEAVVNASRAGALHEIRRKSGLVGYGERAAPIYGNAARCFSLVGLETESRHARDTAYELARGMQLVLPGIGNGSAADEAGDPVQPGYRIAPVLALAIDIHDLDLDLQARGGGGLPRYHGAGAIEVDDASLCAIVNPASSSTRRVVATVSPQPDGYRIGAGHADAFKALLRVSSADPSCAGVEVVSMESPTLSFDREEVLVKSDAPVRFDARAQSSGEHDVALRLHMRSGETARLDFRIPRQVSEEIVYA